MARKKKYKTKKEIKTRIKKLEKIIKRNKMYPIPQRADMRGKSSEIRRLKLKLEAKKNKKSKKKLPLTAKIIAYEKDIENMKDFPSKRSLMIECQNKVERLKIKLKNDMENGRTLAGGNPNESEDYNSCGNGSNVNYGSCGASEEPQKKEEKTYDSCGGGSYGSCGAHGFPTG